MSEPIDVQLPAIPDHIPREALRRVRAEQPTQPQAHALDIARVVDEETHEITEPAWKTYATTGRARTSCSCGLDTGNVPEQEAIRAFDEHQASTRT